MRLASSALMGFTSPSTLAPARAAPKPLNNTLASERFMALHMMLVRMMPAAPTSEPDTMSTLLLMAKPAAQAASPE